MYTSLDTPFSPTRASRFNIPITTRESQYQPFVLNQFAYPNTSRNAPADSSLLSPNLLPHKDRKFAPGVTGFTEKMSDSSRSFYQPPVQLMPGPPNLSKFVLGQRIVHSRGGSYPTPAPVAQNNMMRPSIYAPNPSNFNPLVPNLPVFLSPKAQKQDVREDKVLQFLEKQNAVIEKLAIRIKNEERSTLEREKRELEDKLRNLETAKLFKNQEDSYKVLKANLNNDSPMEPRRLIERKNSKSGNTLEQLGKFYLMSQLFENKNPGAKNLIMNSSPVTPRPASKRQMGIKGAMKKVAEYTEQNEEDDFPSGHRTDRDDVRPRKKKKLRILKTKPEIYQPEADEDDDEEQEAESARLPRSISESRIIKLPAKSKSSKLKKHNNNSRGYIASRDLSEDGTSLSPSRKVLNNATPVQSNYSIRDVSPDQELAIEEEMDEDEEDEAPRRVKAKKTKKKIKKGLSKAEKLLKANEEAEETKKVEQAKKIAARKKLYLVLWLATYPQLLTDTVKSHVETRKADVGKVMTDNIELNFEAAQRFLLQFGEQVLKELLRETKPLELYNAKKNISPSDLDSRATFIFTKCKALFDKLITATNAANLPRHFLKFLASISEDFGVLPNNFMFDFEIKRIQFTHYGTIKSMTPQKSKMVMGMFILLRVLLHKIVMRPGGIIPGISKDKVKAANLMTIGSILYHTVMDFYRGNVAMCPKNQDHLPLEKRIKPRSVPLIAVDIENPSAQDAVSRTKDLEPISGFLTKDQLRCFFVDRKRLYDPLKALIDGYLEKLYEIVHKTYMDTPREQRQFLGTST